MILIVVLLAMLFVFGIWGTIVMGAIWVITALLLPVPAMLVHQVSTRRHLPRDVVIGMNLIAYTAYFATMQLVFFGGGAGVLLLPLFIDAVIINVIYRHRRHAKVTTTH